MRDIGLSTSGGFNNFENWARKKTSISYDSVLKEIGQSTVNKLKESTPKRTGKTAASWTFSIKKTGSGHELSFKNSSKTSTGTPIPILIYNGHGTGTGGYVPARDFINPIIDPAFTNAANKIAREIIK